MTNYLDERFQQYCMMMRDGLVPTGLVIEYTLLQKISKMARRDDPRVEWGESGPERLFGFKPQFVLQAPPRFTLPPALAARKAKASNFTLRELRAL